VNGCAISLALSPPLLLISVAALRRWRPPSKPASHPDRQL